ncbi:FecCD family ABC transporter permease [Desulfitobacterium chlororespirans]|uniref:Iron complex transport system permease protein n=1 Tax=Desulfitobacterium chlororespirans DSM 11544 TaxID=1121395 RepID=A0A1M7UR50_9FIRM|nr:iron ABC transporter permease [Desulfitobacterium chlororespirans]SHN85404.1 iron complex transport system permease protein [Desulfitobacterium chlororespirans DSM 11544]
MHKNHQRLLFLGLLFSGVLVAMLLAVNCGYARISYDQVLMTVWRPWESGASLVLVQIRLPRIVLAVLCGMGLALSGCTLQSVTENPLADPGILGINAGAGLMVVIFLAYFPSLHLYAMIYQPLFALAGGLLVAVFLYGFSRRRGKVNTDYLLLGGIAAAAGFSALMVVMGADMENNSYQAVARWLAGNIWGSSWYQVKTLLPYLLVLIPFLLWRAGIMDVLQLGEETASSLGIKVEKERLLLLFIAVALAASCISVSGGIGFIGLVAPHIARRIVGVRHGYLLPASMLTGGLFLLLADTAGRSLFQSIEVPVGIVISVLAAPYFLYLLHRR